MEASIDLHTPYPILDTQGPGPDPQRATSRLLGRYFPVALDALRPLPHQRLRVWHKAIALIELCNRAPPKDAELRNHALRAVSSVALNTAEGAPLKGKARKRYFSIARASLVEVAAAYEIAHTLGDEIPFQDVMVRVDEIYAMLTKLLQHER